jgi:hypothetical protein
MNNAQSTVGWLEEIQDQNFDGDAFGACTTNTFSLSDRYGNDGGWCTLSVECMDVC